MKKQYKEKASSSFAPIRPRLKWMVLGGAVLIGMGSVLYTNHLVSQIREREKRQIEIYARSLEFLGSEEGNVLIIEEIITANNTIPVVLTSEDGTPEFYKNIPKADHLPEGEPRKDYLRHQVSKMKEQYEPIRVTLKDDQGNVYGYKLIYYKNSFLLGQLRYYPYVQLTVIALFGVITFWVLNYLRTSEQNRVWIGMAKETAHQLGTPLSSLMAWSEYFKGAFPDQKEVMHEFDKDIDRLKVITDRFSSIGSEPQLERVDVVDVISEVMGYLQKRLSRKVKMTLTQTPAGMIEARVNVSLFAWVIENLCKNATDAMEGAGDINIRVLKANGGRVVIHIADSGKGIHRANINEVFRPGFTTKKRGWGLGLALAKRIIEQYHQGRIFVKSSEINRGTTFRISLISEG